jgi:hypothetical protein
MENITVLLHNEAIMSALPADAFPTEATQASEDSQTGSNTGTLKSSLSFSQASFTGMPS